MVVSAGCAACRRARQLVEAVRQLRPAHPVEVIDLDDRDSVVPAGVVGTPTFLLGEEVVAMGNPDLRLLLDTLDDVGSTADGQ